MLLGTRAEGESQWIDAVMAAAAAEAMSGGFSEVETAHLLMGLSRVAQASSTLPAHVVGGLSAEFRSLGIAPQEFRRGLRRILGHGGGGHDRGSSHRSAACRAVFAEAQRRAAAEGAPAGLVHLFQASLASLASVSKDHPADFEVPEEL